jgi:alpha-L-arabinofuranosidase
VDAEIVILGADGPTVHGAKGRQLTGVDIHDHNNFDNPQAVRPVDVVPFWKGGDRSTSRLPAHSVSAVELELA